MGFPLVMAVELMACIVVGVVRQGSSTTAFVLTLSIGLVLLTTDDDEILLGIVTEPRFDRIGRGRSKVKIQC